MLLKHLENKLLGVEKIKREWKEAQDPAAFRTVKTIRENNQTWAQEFWSPRYRNKHTKFSQFQGLKTNIVGNT